jgi:hypothetical protein
MKNVKILRWRGRGITDSAATPDQNRLVVLVTMLMSRSIIGKLLYTDGMFNEEAETIYLNCFYFESIQMTIEGIVRRIAKKAEEEKNQAISRGSLLQ